jgi:cell division septum initiation protein DivIVA
LTGPVILLAVAGDQEWREVRSESETEPLPGQQTQDARAEQHADRERAELRDVSFPIAVRGYERHAVDAYRDRVNRVIADLESGSSPPAAVKHAMDRVSEQIGGLLQHARQAAEEITAGALAEAEATTAQARTEAAQIMDDAELKAQQLRARSQKQADEVLAQATERAAKLMRSAEEQARAVEEQAEPRLRELEADTEAVWDARRTLLEDLPRIATELMGLAGAANGRFQRPRDRSRAPAPSGQPRPERATWTQAQAHRAAPGRSAGLDRGSAPTHPTRPA